MKKKEVQAFSNGPIYQFWFQDEVLHMWTNQRSGVYTMALNKTQYLEFLVDLDHDISIDRGTVYELMGINIVETGQ